MTHHREVGRVNPFLAKSPKTRVAGRVTMVGLPTIRVLADARGKH
jgi:hypothetical protein